MGKLNKIVFQKCQFKKEFKEKTKLLIKLTIFFMHIYCWDALKNGKKCTEPSALNPGQQCNSYKPSA